MVSDVEVMQLHIILCRFRKGCIDDDYCYN